MITKMILKELARKLEETAEEAAKTKRFDIMRKALHLLSPKNRDKIDQTIRIERGHLSPELEAAWRSALKQAEETS